MRHSLLLTALIATAISGMTPALAADEDMPPEFRTSTFEIYTGVFGAANTLRSDVLLPSGAIYEELDGTGFGYGIRGGFDYLMDGWLVGAVGDWSFGKQVAEGPRTEASLTNLGTLRGRAGVNLGNTVVYVTGGIARAELEFGINDTAPPPVSGQANAWSTSWTLGGGIDVGITDSITLGVEYLYVDFKDPSYTFQPSGTPTPPTETFEHRIDGIHTVRVGMNYAFSI